MAAAVLPGEPFKHTGADGPGHVEITGVRAVWHWRPVGAALTGGLRHRLVPERLKDAAGLEIGLRLGALRHRCMQSTLYQLTGASQRNGETVDYRVIRP